jgi:hypothetical protein
MKMWKIIVGFILFAGLALYLLNKGGDIDMGGEKHGQLGSPMSSAVPRS